MLITLPVVWIVILDFVAWFFFHMVISLLCMKIPDSWYACTQRGFESQKWEKNGALWQNLFGIRNWKKFLPDGSAIVKDAYNKTHLHSINPDSLKKFILETKRAELTHWGLILPSFLFFIWNPPWAGFLMIIYALIANIPFILTQRYNRPRLERLLEVIMKRHTK